VLLLEYTHAQSDVSLKDTITLDTASFANGSSPGPTVVDAVNNVLLQQELHLLQLSLQQSSYL
jgi:hypothetical protein